MFNALLTNMLHIKLNFEIKIGVPPKDQIAINVQSQDILYCSSDDKFFS